MHEAVQSSWQCPKFITTPQGKKKKIHITRWSARWRYFFFFLASLLFFPCSSCSSFWARRMVPGPQRSAPWFGLFFFSLSHFFRSSFWWRGSASFVNTLPAVVSTRWFPFVAFVCGCSQNMCMSSDVSVTKRQLVSQRRKKLLTGGRVGGRRVLVSARTGKEHPGRGGRQKAGTGRHARQPSSRNHTGNDKKKARY